MSNRADSVERTRGTPPQDEGEGVKTSKLATSSSHPASTSKGDPLHRALLDGMLDPVITIDEHGIIETASRSTQKLFGYAPEELIGRNINVLMLEPHHSQHDDYLEHYRQTGETHVLGNTRSFEVAHKDGHPLTVELSVARVDVPGRDAPTFVGSFRDTTERDKAKRREASLLRALSTLGESTAILVHEIKNPLTAVNLALRAVANKLGEDEQAVLRDLAARMRHLEQQLRQSLTFARPIELNAVPYTAQDLFADTVHSMRPIFEAAGIDVTQLVEDGTPEFMGDPPRLEEVLNNLVLNAVEMMPDGGRIHLTAAPFGDSAITLEIEDDGPGVPEHVRETLFRAFVTTKSSGTGLGLPICRRIIEDHGGSLTVSPGSRLGGACFRIELPLDGTPETHRERHADY